MTSDSLFMTYRVSAAALNMAEGQRMTRQRDWLQYGLPLGGSLGYR